MAELDRHRLPESVRHYFLTPNRYAHAHANRDANRDVHADAYANTHEHPATRRGRDKRDLDADGQRLDFGQGGLDI